MKTITVRFYKSESGNEPVREWLKGLSKDDKTIIGEDIKTVEFGWPLGMPLVRKLDRALWEVRSDITNKEIARVLFTVKNDVMVLSFFVAVSSCFKRHIKLFCKSSKKTEKLK